VKPELDLGGENDEQGSEEGENHGRQTEDLLRLQALKFEDSNTGMSTFHREKVVMFHLPCLTPQKSARKTHLVEKNTVG
jgi:hypothetical protein